MMKLVFLYTVILILSGTCGGESEISLNDIPKNTTALLNPENLNGVEVPDSSLLLLHRMTFRGLEPQRQIRRKADKNETESQEEETGSRLCTCALGVCKCCTGYVLDLFNQKACMRITYHPGDFAFDVAMSLNDRILYENSMSGRNPRPICISPPRMPNLKVCAKFHDVFFPGRNFHFCLSMNGQWRALQLFDVSFNCLRMGANGIAMMKPEDVGGLPIPNPQGGVDAVVDSGEDDIEDYDENLVKSLLNIFD